MDYVSTKKTHNEGPGYAPFDIIVYTVMVQYRPADKPEGSTSQTQ